MSVVRWLTEYPGPAEYELYRHGLDPCRLDSDDPPWHEAFLYLRYAPEGGPFKTAVHGYPQEGVTLHSMIDAGILDGLKGLIYGLGGGKGPKPKPTDLTGKIESENTQDYGSGYSIEEMKEMLGRND